MAALYCNETIDQGATFQREYSAVKKVDGQPFNFAGFTFVAWLEDLAGNKLHAFTITQPDDYTILVELTAEQTATLNGTTDYNYKYNLKATSPTGKVYRIAQVRVNVSPE